MPYEVVKQVDIPITVETVVEKLVQVPVPVERRVRQEVQVPFTVQKVVEVPQPHTVERTVQVQVSLSLSLSLCHHPPSFFWLRASCPAEERGCACAWPCGCGGCLQVPYPVQRIVERTVEVPVEVKVRQEVPAPYPVQKIVEVPQPYTVDKACTPLPPFPSPVPCFRHHSFSLPLIASSWGTLPFIHCLGLPRSGCGGPRALQRARGGGAPGGLPGDCDRHGAGPRPRPGAEDRDPARAPARHPGMPVSVWEALPPPPHPAIKTNKNIE